MSSKLTYNITLTTGCPPHLEPDNHMNIPFKPNKSHTENDERETNAIEVFTSLLPKNLIKHDIKTGDKVPNIDGYVEILDNDGRVKSKVTVQVKHYPEANYELDKYPIPQYVLGYAHRLPSEVVLLITVDTQNKKVYWKEISPQYINNCAEKGYQGTFTYHFTQDEILTEENKEQTFAIWHNLYTKRVESFKDKKREAIDEVQLAATAFNSINSEFHGLENSYLERPQVNEICNWTINDITDKDSKLALVVGEAGMGKSVILKQVLKQLNVEAIPTYAIKADMHSGQDGISYQTLSETLNTLLSDCDKGVLLIDQIDALSQHLSNDITLLNHYVAMINTFMEESHKDVRIIVSCRRFDLKHDPIISTLASKSKRIEVKQLELREVESTLSKLGIEIKKLNNSTCQLLRTPQHLDIYCRIYHKNKHQSNYSNHIVLYNELWEQVVYHINGKISIDIVDLENYLFDIALAIRKKGTLCPYWPTTAKNRKFIDYLSTQGLIDYDGKKVRFFHQSFYDFTLAKYYCTKNILISDQLATEHQGLFIRSTVKTVLDYVREHDFDLYKAEINKLLHHKSNTRYHIKLLIFQVLGSSKNIDKFEINTIKGIKENTNNLFFDFITQASSSEWLYHLSVQISDELEKNSSTEQLSTLIHFVSEHANDYPVLAFEIISKIKKDRMKSWAIWKALYRVTDFTHRIVIDSYYTLKPESLNYRILARALDTNLEFVVKETKQLLPLLIKESESGKRHDTDLDSFIDDVCQPFMAKAPHTCYPVLRDIVINAISESKKTMTWGNGLALSYAFENDNETHDKLLGMLVNYLTAYSQSRHAQVKKDLQDLIKQCESTCEHIVYKVIGSCPEQFMSTFFALIEDKERILKVLYHTYVKEQFILTLKNIFAVANKDQKEEILYSLATFDSVTLTKYETVKNIEFEQLELICSIPDEEHNLHVRKVKETLVQKHPSHYEYINNGKQISFPRGIDCPSIEECRKFTIDDWVSAFACSPDIFEPSYKRQVSQNLSNVISEEPQKHLQLVTDIFAKDDISDMYKYSGLIGLLEGGIPPSELVSLFSQVMENIDYKYDYSELFSFYCKEESKLTNSIIDILIAIAKHEYKKKSYGSSSMNNGSASVSLGNFLNSNQGRALKLIIGFCKFPKRRKDIYNLLIEMKPDLHHDLQLGVIYHIHNEDYFNKELLQELTSKYTIDSDSADFLIVRHDLFHYFWYNNPSIVYNYFLRVLSKNDVQKNLAAIMYFGTQYAKAKELSEQLLQKIIDNNNPLAISTLIEISYKNCSEDKYKTLSMKILQQFVDDDRKEIIKAYVFHCSDLPPNNFIVFQKIYASLESKIEVSHTTWILRYIKKCTTLFPIDCSQILYRLAELNKGNRFNNNEIMEVLLGLYRNLEDDALDIKEEVMDTFDYIIKENIDSLDRVFKDIDE